MPGPPATDEQLADTALIRLSWEEPEVFAGVFDRHAPLLHRYAARRLGPDAAEDVVSETFLAAFQHRHRYDVTQDDARPWLYGIASKVIGKRRRAEITRYRAYARSGVPPAEPSGGLVEDGVTTLAVNLPLVAALAALQARDRDVLLLVAWAELTYEEVAQALDIPVGTVRSRLNRARKKVRQALDRTSKTRRGGQDDE
ncbi:RNA polymerase sigma factor [Nonomuraea gerenzanensis]|uniref:RNA polymerase ECF-subfamily sigma factor n=1 Tax=Nonomuraea gerenzanensis TaxID=93944 RepID=A0A1M4E3Y1_9ACTN|nr:RNA polymerase sigma factor [Nonomuraea gerenzanensis]UBU15695.1 RNA polymerase sigma factor [Nonomuraea gerenzanensis]SBO93470.1 RNA polymerase ECF-subfamily sigma factor [Nonomuraea gerenzanensis]